MTTAHPFKSDFEGKPKWLRKDIHIPRESDFEENLDSILPKVRSGKSEAIMIFPSMKGVGLTHFVHRELIPLLESKGCAVGHMGVLTRPTDAILPKTFDLPAIVAKLSTPPDIEIPKDDQRWLCEEQQEAYQRMDWRKGLAIASEERAPYPVKVFSHSLKRVNNEPEFEEKEEEEFNEFHFGRRKEPKGSFGNLRALGKIAKQNGRVLCIVANQYLSIARSERFGRGHFDNMERMLNDAAPYLQNSNTLLILVLSNPCPKSAMEYLRLRNITAGHLRSQNKEWTRKVLKAHQDISGKQYFTDEALDAIAEHFKGRVGHAFALCSRLIRKPKSLPIDARCVKTFMKKQRYFYDSKGLRIRF